MTTDSEFFKAIKPIFCVYKLFGLGPIQILEKPQLKFVAYQRGIFYILYCCLIAAILISANVLTFSQWFFNFFLKYEDAALQVNYFIEIGIGVILTLFALLVTYVHRFKFCEIFDGIEMIDKVFNQMGIAVSYENTKKFAKGEIILAICLLAIHIICRLYQNRILVHIIIMFICVDYTFFMIALFLSQFSNFLLLLQQRAVLVNKFLKSLNNPKHKTAFLNKYFYNHVHISNAMNISNKIYIYSKMINDIFATQILIVCAFMFQNIISEMYQLYKSISIDNTWGPSTLMMAKWLLNSYAMLFLIATPCEKLKCEVRMHF